MKVKSDKIKPLLSRLSQFLLGVCTIALAGMMASCNDDDVKSEPSAPFDPSLPVTVTGFTPENGGSQEEIIVYGSNFGNNKDNVSLYIGEKKAVVINVMSDKLFAFIPAGAYSESENYTGSIEVVVNSHGTEKSGVAPKPFHYTPKKVVGTLCGYRNENDDQGEVWGPFDKMCGFNAEGTLALDPLYPDRLYVVYDRSDGIIACLDLKKRVAERMMSATKFQTKRLRNIAFTLDGKYMLVSTDRDDNGLHSTSVWVVTRNADGTFSDRSSCQPLAAYKQCNGVAVHPVNGEIYFNSYENGQLFRLDFNDYLKVVNGGTDENGEPLTWTGYRDDGAFRELFKIMDPSYEFQITIHPSGDYAYITVINRNYILRSDYDWKKKEFTTPYVISGSNGIPGWTDAVGTNARVNRPYQGVFVKNPEYEADGRTDVYDYYFSDCLNFCVRYITPDGLVRTFAGRSPSTNGNIWGTEDGDLRQQARFRDVTGLCYDTERERFYVLDHNNRSVRTIGMESSDMLSNNDKDDNAGDNNETESK